MQTSMTDTGPVYIPETDLERYCSQNGLLGFNAQSALFFVKLGLLPTFTIAGETCFLVKDLGRIIDLLVHSKGSMLTTPLHIDLFSTVDKHTIKIGSHTALDLAYGEPKDPAFFSAVSNLMEFSGKISSGRSPERRSVYFSGSSLTTVSDDVIAFAESQLSRSRSVDMAAVSHFASSAHYMGSKRLLCGFIVEGIASILPESGVVLDLMCGSGVASGALSKVWETYASDAQDFCRILAVVHGGGFSKLEGEAVLSKILPTARQHFDDLQQPLYELLEAEEAFFCSDLEQDSVVAYKTFIEALPTVSNGIHNEKWQPEVEVARRVLAPKTYPYCLFTTYFPTTYFGLRQCLEIDSLRYAIDQITDENQKNWALGALVATISAIGTTFAGHFAQPPVIDFNASKSSKLSDTIFKRSFSITHEFSVRFLSLSEKSESGKRNVNILPGPWENTLLYASSRMKDKKVVVYLDAPYTREEYSRFYHVLETLVRYSYPSCTGKGLTPKPGERFRSEFFTKTQSKIEESLATIITKVLQSGWACAWSYSDSGAACIGTVISTVSRLCRCTIHSYSVPFVHKSQGGVSPKNVKEYLVIFTPSGWIN